MNTIAFVIINVGVFIFCILLLGSISGIFSEKAGIINIAINGMIVFGALVYTVINYLIRVFGNSNEISMYYQLLLVPLCGIITALFALVFGYATIRLKSNQTITGYAINILVFGITAIAFLIIKQRSGNISFATKELALESDITSSLKNLVSLKVFLTLLIVVLSFIALKYTRWGLRFKAIGENPQAADVAGINIYKYKWHAVFISGLIAGIAGTFFGQIRLGQLQQSYDIQGLGYLALAIMITSQWKIAISVLISLMFSIVYSFSFYGVQYFPASYKNYSELFNILPFITTLIVMIAFSKKTNAPAALGVIYDKSKR